MTYTILAPYEPTSQDPWDVRKAAHLCRRAGFGAPRSELDAVLAMGPTDAVDRFLRPDPQADRRMDELFELNRSGFVMFDDPHMLQAWWLFRMLNTPFALREKMTLFWHGHFATSFRKVESMRHMHGQNRTLRRGALGDFRDLVLDVSRDPAMILWLDNQENRKGRPNENFARELMELFTLGEGHYTERDVREAARAFTGWHEREARFFFDERAHDNGVKELLGRSGRFNGDDVVDIVLQQPRARRFIAEKLLRFFVMPEPTTDLVDEGERLMGECNFEIKWFMRTILLSKAFYAAQAYRSKIKSPVEFAVGAVRDLDGTCPGQVLAEMVASMGQELYAPPSVKGWDGERDWISSTAWLARGRFAEFFTTESNNVRLGLSLPVERTIALEEREPEAYVDRFLDRLVQGDVPDEVRRRLVDFMTRNEEGREEPHLFREAPEFRFEKTRAMIRLVLTLRQYHLC